MIAQFPSQRITTEIDKMNARLPTAEKDIFEMTVTPIVEVCLLIYITSFNCSKIDLKNHLFR